MTNKQQGDITDPPAVESLPQARFAQPIPRPSSPEFAAPDESLFCKTCLQNQRFLTEALASYFPPSNDPDYPEYERNYPEYRKNLEDRYPQVCRKCEPRVRDRIRITGYAAKTDHLRRMMERSRESSSRVYHGWTWKRVALFIGAVGWYTSIAGQILWNLGGALTTEGDERGDGLIDDTSPSISTCLAQSWISGRVTSTCSQQFAALAGPALGLGFLSIWWNPRFKEKLERGSGRILGLTEYYKIQFIFLVLRFGSYLALTRSTVYDFDAGTRRAMHSFLIIFALIVCCYNVSAYQTNLFRQSAIISFRSTKLDLAARVLFNDGLAPLTQQSHDNPHESQYDRPSGRQQSETPKARSAIQPRPFPLNDLAPDHARSRPLPYKSPTPPPNEDGIEEMDWTPSQQPFQPAPPIHQLTIPTIAQPSPFYGRLPPAPLSQAHKLRNPPNQPAFRQATAVQKQSFFNNRRRWHIDRDNMSEASTECFDSPIKTAVQSEAASPRFAEPRFFPQSDYERDTGLESMFSNIFSIAEEPHEVRVARERVKDEQERLLVDQRQAQGFAGKKLQAASFIALAFSCLAWISAPSIPLPTAQIHGMCLVIAAIVAGQELAETIRKDKVYWNWSDMFVYSLELCSSLFLSKAISKLSPPKQEKGKGTGIDDELRIAGLALLGIMFLQELWIWISKLKLERTTPVSVSASTPISPQASSSPPSQSPPLNLKSSAAPPPPINNKARTDEPFSLLSPTKKKDSSKLPQSQQQQPQRPQQQPHSALSASASTSFSSSSFDHHRITRSKSKRESISTAATNGLGSLSLGGGEESGSKGGGAAGGRAGWGKGAGSGNGMRSTRMM